MDMNSGFQKAFQENCSWIQVVFDRFPIDNNFNDRAIAEIRKSEQIRLMKEGLDEEAALLNGSR